jgi:ribosomal protein L35
MQLSLISLIYRYNSGGKKIKEHSLQSKKYLNKKNLRKSDVVNDSENI